MLVKWFVSASGYFSGLSFIEKRGVSAWTEPVAPEALAWQDEDGATIVGVCDFTPGWHGKTGRLIGIGHTVRYRKGQWMKDPRPRETAYAVFDPGTRKMTECIRSISGNEYFRIGPEFPGGG